MDKLAQAIELLKQIIEDRTVPKNIREAAQRAKESLEGDDELKVRIDRAIHALDSVSEDPNMPIYTRTQIWNIVSILESM